jgi:Bax protein
MPDHIKGNKFSLNSKIPDFSTYKDINDKKNDFFAFLLPKIKYANDNILKERRQVFDLKVALPNLSKDEVSTLNALKDKYEVSLTNHEDAINALLKRVDIIPASLALAQAANESAWGTSRFAQEGNNLFGQWCYVKGCGIIPKQRHGKQRHEVAKFDGIVDSIESYMRNLNSQAAYEKLRTLRAEAREDEDVITGVNLANGLWSYSIRREAYVHEIQLMIKQNGLQQYNRPVSHTN